MFHFVVKNWNEEVIFKYVLVIVCSLKNNVYHLREYHRYGFMKEKVPLHLSLLLQLEVIKFIFLCVCVCVSPCACIYVCIERCCLRSIFVLISQGNKTRQCIHAQKITTRNMHVHAHALT